MLNLTEGLNRMLLTRKKPTVRLLKLSSSISFLLFLIYLLNNISPFLSLGPEQRHMNNSIITWLLFSFISLCIHWLAYHNGTKNHSEMHQFIMQNVFNIISLIYFSLQIPPIYWWYATRESFPMLIPMFMIITHGLLAIISFCAMYKVIKNGLLSSNEERVE